MERKEWKRRARASLKQHYWMFVLLCVLLGMMGYEYTDSLTAVTSATKAEFVHEITPSDTETAEPTNSNAERLSTEKTERYGQILDLLLSGQVREGKALSDETLEAEQSRESQLGVIAIGHSRGVLSQIVNSASSGAILFTVYDGIKSITHSQNAAIVLFIILGILFYAVMWLLFLNVIHTVTKRFFMEARLYRNIPFKRFLFFARAKKWGNTAKTILLTDLFALFWSFTVIGGVIKYFSYAMVPYILCENPTMKPRQVITLSRRLMKGHKWEMFKLRLSFIGWDLLGVLTLGLVSIFYANPYQEAAYAEYYAYIRAQGREKKLPDSDLLDDRLLYEMAEDELLETVYHDVLSRPPLPDCRTEYKNPVARFFANVFGIVLRYDDVAENYNRKVLREDLDDQYLDILAHNQYPGRLYLIPNREKNARVENVNNRRLYSVQSLILMFFSICFVGWAWEVSLHLINDGVFVNRGILHGPCLPIYGYGSVLILVALNRLRKKPAVQFTAAVILCGIVEYSTSYFMEIAHNGQKWWDYSGYFLNINGRICAEGLLVFGLGGIAVVYLVAPLLDNLFRRIPKTISILLCIVLLCVYIGDSFYSSEHPNAGEGITAAQVVAEPLSPSERFLLPTRKGDGTPC